MDHIADIRYNTPRPPLMTPKDVIDKAIDNNKIYREVKDLLKDEESREAQRIQVGYGMSKYPETLNDESWSILEALEHIQGELVDGLHYISLLKEKYLKEQENNKP